MQAITSIARRFHVQVKLNMEQQNRAYDSIRKVDKVKQPKIAAQAISKLEHDVQLLLVENQVLRQDSEYVAGDEIDDANDTYFGIPRKNNKYQGNDSDAAARHELEIKVKAMDDVVGRVNELHLDLQVYSRTF